MFARAIRHFTAGGAHATAVATVLVLGSACKGIDSCDCLTYTLAAVARGANVIPALSPGDTSARASATFNSSTLAYTYSVLVAPAGTIDSIALYQIPPSDSLPASATAILCANTGVTGAAACTAGTGSGYPVLVPPATVASVTTSMRGYGTQLVFFTTTAQKAAGGAMRGTVYVSSE